MVNFSPKELVEIRKRIRKYERILEKEKRRMGDYHDGGGLRYLLGPHYLLAGDLNGALASFRWFEEAFDDDSGEPGHMLCWALAKLRAGQEGNGARKLGQAMLRNLYVIPHLLGSPIEPLKIWHGSNLAEPDYVDQMPPEYFGIWSAEEVEWAKGRYQSPVFQDARKRYIEIFSELKDLRTGDKRSRLVDEASDLEEFNFEFEE